MKRILTITLILILSVCSLSAVTTASDSFEVVAYKKQKTTEPISKLEIIDALTGDLKNISNNTEIEMTKYVNNYVEDTSSKITTSTSGEKTTVSSTTYKETALNEKAIFSIHVNGNATGSYSITTTFGEFAKIDDSTKVIKAYYFLRRCNGFFTSTGSKTSQNSEKTLDCQISDISITDKVEQIASVKGEGVKSLGFSWTVNSKSTDDTKYSTTITKDTVVDYWEVEAMVALVIDKTVYNTLTGDDSVPNGTYKAMITVNMTAN